MTKTGTVSFSAPEIFQNVNYDEKVDIWSAGIVLYMMLCGKQPFQSQNIPELVKYITTSEPDIKNDLEEVSSLGIDLLQNLLQKDPE